MNINMFDMLGKVNSERMAVIICCSQNTSNAGVIGSNIIQMHEIRIYLIIRYLLNSTGQPEDRSISEHSWT